MSGAARNSAGRPWRKKRSPGPNSTAVARASCAKRRAALAHRLREQVVEGGDEVRAHVQDQQRSGQRRRRAARRASAPRARPGAVRRRCPLVSASLSRAHGLRAVARRLDGADEIGGRGGAAQEAHACALGGEIDARLQHARHGERGRVRCGRRRRRSASLREPTPPSRPPPRSRRPPPRETAARGSAGPSKATSARSVAGLTLALATPGSARRARSTRSAQDAQCIPSTARLRRLRAGVAVAGAGPPARAGPSCPCR